MENISIRRATFNDLPTIQKLNQKLCAKENKEYDATINSDYSFSKVGEEYFISRIESENSLVLIAEKGGGAIGYLIGGVAEPEDYRTVDKIAEVENMYIEKEFQGQGIGTQLDKQFEDWCRKNKVEIIKYVASFGNIEAIQFYKKHGAKEVNITLEKKLNK